MRLAVLAMFVFVVSVGSSVLAQNRSGPPTLENLLNGDNSGATAKAENSPAAEDEEKSVPPTGTYVRPKNGLGDPELDKAWADYNAAVEKASETLREAIQKRMKAERDAGKIDAAKKYKTMLELLDKQGTLPEGDRMLKNTVDDVKRMYAKSLRTLEEEYDSLSKQRLKNDAIKDPIAAADAIQSEWKSLTRPTQSPFVGLVDAPIGQSIPPDARKIDRHLYYVFVEEKVTQAEAVDRCIKKGGYLARITKPNEFAAFTELLLPQKKKMFLWIDGTDSRREGEWTHLDGSPMPRRLPWTATQPDNFENKEHGLTWWLWHENGKWVTGLNDFPQDKRCGYICEWDEAK